MSDMTRRGRIKVESHHNNNIWETSMDLDLCLQTATQLLVENSKPKVKSVIDVGEADINQIRNVVPSMQSVHIAVICQKGKGFSHSSRSAHVVETSSGASTSQTELDFYTQCGQPIHVQSHMLQTMSIKSQKIPEKSKLMLEFPIGLQYKDLNQKVLLKIDTGSDINYISLGTFQSSFLTSNSTDLHYC